MEDCATKETNESREPEKFWMVWRQGGKRPRHKHIARATALDEARRVAERHPGCTTYVLEAVVAYTAPLPVVTANYKALGEAPQRVEKI